ncbi:hypothetical protein RFI_21931, partial [Reticulomyxa filosa]
MIYKQQTTNNNNKKKALAVWCAFTWESMGKPDKIRLIEFGPGLGTVAKAVLDLSRLPQLGPFREAVQIHLVESSSRMRWKQKNKLNLGNVRKFTVKVKKPVYTTSFPSQLEKRIQKQQSGQSKSKLQ